MLNSSKISDMSKKVLLLGSNEHLKHGFMICGPLYDVKLKNWESIAKLMKPLVNGHRNKKTKSQSLFYNLQKLEESFYFQNNFHFF